MQAQHMCDDDNAASPPQYVASPKKPIFSLTIVATLSLLVGALGGYYIAFQTLSSQCETILSVSRSKHEERYQNIKDRLTAIQEQEDSKECSLNSEKDRVCADELERVRELASKVEFLELVNHRYATVLLSLKECNTGLEKSRDEISTWETSFSEIEAESLREIRMMEEKMAQLSETIKKCLLDTQTQKKQFEELQADYDDLDSYVQQIIQERREVEKELEVSEKKVDGWIQTVDRMEDFIADWSRRIVVENYGDGPYRVIINLRFLDYPSEDAKSVDRFVIELAPLDLMPHAVYSFLDMVSRKLYDGCYFAIGSSFVVAAAPDSKDPNRRMELQAPFKEVGLIPSLAYQEYHPDFPHGLYTVGFSGGPPVGGPAFYVSVTGDTSKLGHRDRVITDEYGIPIGEEPCFGKIVEGVEVIERISAIPREPSYGFGWLTQQVMIESAIVSSRQI